MPFFSFSRRRAGRVLFAAATAVGLFATAGPASAALLDCKTSSTVRVDLRVLVLDDGQPMTRSIVAQLDREGVPYQAVNLTDGARPTIDSAFLRASDKEGPRALYQAVVAPKHAPDQLSEAELAELYDFEQDFGIRQVSAYVWPEAAIGLATPVYSGPIDGAAAQVTSQAKSAGFDYLSGAFTFDDFDPSVTESYGYVAQAAPDLANGATWTPFVTATVGGVTGSVLGVYTEGRHEEMVLTFGQNEYQQHAAALGHGIVQWMTRGIHLGEYRNYYSIHVDDVFMADNMWSMDGNCTIGDDCDPNVYPETMDGATVRMVAEDVTVAKNWQNANGIKLDMAYNANGSVEFAADNNKKDPVYDAFKAARKDFRWLNHTYTHLNLGCVKDYATTPWSCAKDARGNVIYQSVNTVRDEIDKNKDWGNAKGFTTDKHELVPGEHSGLATLPQMPQDSANFLAALVKEDVEWVASDASREMNQRAAGKETLTVPRYPMSVYYNTSTYEEAADEYNWIYTSRANGGSGICEDMPEVTTCITPLDTATGYLDYIVPREIRTTMRHATTSDPRPHFVHQTNLTDDRLLYPVLDGFMNEYRAVYNAKSTPLVNPTLTEAGEIMQLRDAWAAQKNNTTATLADSKITITGGSTRVDVPVTAGPNTSSSNLDQSYAGVRSEWIDVKAKATKSISLSSKDAGYPAYQDMPAPTVSQGVGLRAAPVVPTTIVPPAEAKVETTPSWSKGPSNG